MTAHPKPGRTRAPFARRLAAATDGVTIIEFALIAPVLMMMLIGILDFGHTVYMNAALQGAVQKAARDSSLQNATAAQLDASVIAQVKSINPSMSDPVITRRFFRDYDAANAHQFEPFTDKNKNKTCDAGESYTDTNWNSKWDEDGADEGQGGAQDRTVYTVTVSYPRLFPLYNFISASANINLVATTVLANQPYDAQAKYRPNPVSLKCP